MSKVRKLKHIEANVWDTTLDRIRHIYDTFDKVTVSFSGGKDSTAVLNATLVVARERNKLPLEAIFYDEEAIHPPTIEYVQRVSEHPDIDLKWFCLEVKHRNACSNEEPWWYNWEKGKEHLWVREMPEQALTEHPGFQKGLTIPEFSHFLADKSDGRVARLTGIRTEESMRRYRIIATKKEEPYINRKASPRSNTVMCHPIYDWKSQDVWLAVHKFGWDYNKTYDIMNKTKIHGKYLTQRVCPPFGEEPLRGLWMYAECFPEMWHKMLRRVKGVGTAWRYANGDLYSRGNKPEGQTYKDYIKVIIASYDADSQKEVKRVINKYIKAHKKETSMPIPETEYHPITGCAWKFLVQVAKRGDFKGRQASNLVAQAMITREKLGLSLEQAKELFK